MKPCSNNPVRALHATNEDFPKLTHEYERPKTHLRWNPSAAKFLEINWEGSPDPKIHTGLIAFGKVEVVGVDLQVLQHGAWYAF